MVRVDSSCIYSENLIHSAIMRSRGAWTAVLIFFSVALRIAAQGGPAVAAREFEAASLKMEPSADHGPRMTGGPGTLDPGRIAYSRITLANLVAKAYGLAGDQVFGPAWFTSETYSLNATLRPDTTQEQFQLMLQRLLSERFNLRVHHELRELSGYQLTVGKKGPNLKNLKLVPDAPEPEDPADGDLAGAPPQPSKRSYSDDKDGCPVFSTPGVHFGGVPGPKGCLGYQNISIAELCTNLGALINFRDGVHGQAARVLDRTGLAGQYDFNLRMAYVPYSMRNWTIMQQTNGPDDFPPLEVALEQQLGLKLESIKEPLDAVIVDQADRMPAEN